MKKKIRKLRRNQRHRLRILAEDMASITTLKYVDYKEKVVENITRINNPMRCSEAIVYLVKQIRKEIG